MATLQTYSPSFASTEDERSEEEYAASVNPQWTRLLKLLQMDARYERCIGAELFATDGRRILDFLAGGPAVFESLLAVHVGAARFADLCSWNLLGFARAFVAA